MVAWLSHLFHTTSIAEQYVSSVNEAYANMRLQPPANKPAGLCLYHDGLLFVPTRLEGEGRDPTHRLRPKCLSGRAI
jgi:hypothetical protein